MKIIKIEDGRKLNVSCLVVGYLEENKIEKLQFEIPEEYKDFGRKACFKANDKTFAKSFDNITDNTLTLTRDMTQYNELEMSIAFFKIENEDEIVARTSILKIYIENAIVCDDDIKPDEPKVVILDGLIQKVTELNEQVTKDEEIRQNQETTRQQNETVRQENETVRETNEQDRIKNELARKKAEEERKTNENAREEYISNLKTQVDNGEFDGADFNYKWDDTKLGVKNSKETTYQFVELKGDKGDKGDTGNGIQNIEKVSTVENVDTYAIHYTDGTQTTFDVTNGEVTKEQLDEVDNRAKKTRNELERVKNDILETGTASDSFINVQDSAWAELQELSVDGVCEQQATPSPDYPQEIETITGSLKLTSCGKNFLTNQYQKNSTIKVNGISFRINNDNSVTVNGTATENAIIYPIAVENAFTLFPGTYTFSGCPAGGGSTKYKQDILTLNNAVIITDYGNQTYSRVLSTNTALIMSRIVIYKGFTANNLVFKPMLEISSAPSAYEEHIQSQININLPEGEFIGKIDDTYKDTLKVVYKEDGKHHLILNKIISKTVLNGTQPISYSKVINDDKFVAQFNIGTAIKSSSPMISDKFTYLSNGWASNSENISTGGSSNNLLQIKISQSRLEEVSNNGFNNWLSTHPVEVYYALEKPYEVDLGIVDMPLSYDEITNIFTDSDLLPQINAKYYRNFTKTVQNLQINEKALKQELIDINNRLTALETAKVSESEVNNDIPVE